MSISSTGNREEYLGNDSTDTYNYTFRIFSASDLRVVQVTDEGVKSVLVLNTDYTVTGVGNGTGGTIVLTAGNLEQDYVLIIQRRRPLTQLTDIRNQGDFYPETHEDFFDKSIMIDQQQQEQIDRSIKLDEQFTTSDFDTILPVEVTEVGTDRFLKIKDDGTGFEVVQVAGSGGGAGLEIGLPTDGAYGDPVLGDPTNLQETDVLPDALDKIVSLLALIVPAPPEELSAKTLEIIGQYTALAASTGASHTCTDDTTPSILPNGDPTVNYANSFRDANGGTLSAEMDSAEIGRITLTTGDDTGIDGELEIIADFDPYLAQTGEGIFKALVARINSAVLSVGQHIAELIHTTTGSTSLTFYVDDPTTPNIAGVSTGSSGSTSFKSGVPGIAQGQNINVQFDVDDFCGTHYNPTRIAGAQSPQTGAQVDAPLGGPYTSASTFNANINLPVAANAYSEGVVITRRAYNSKGDVVSSNVTSVVRVDTVGTETRVLSSTGQYPASGYGGAFNSTTDVLTGNKELQYINGRFQYPDLVDYTGKVPSGPDYSALTPDAHNNMRWVTFSLGSVSAVTSVTFTFNSTQNFGATTLISGLECYVRVDGATPTTGWIDANAAYPGVGNPTANGDPALDVGSSTVTSRRVTFGAAVKTGTVYVRVGIPSASTKRFSGVS